MELRVTPPNGLDRASRGFRKLAGDAEEAGNRAVVRLADELADEFEAVGPFSALGFQRRVFRPDSPEGNLWIGTWTVPPSYLRNLSFGFFGGTAGSGDAQLVPVHDDVRATVETLIAGMEADVQEIWEDEFNDAIDFDNA